VSVLGFIVSRIGWRTFLFARGVESRSFRIIWFLGIPVIAFEMNVIVFTPSRMLGSSRRDFWSRTSPVSIFVKVADSTVSTKLTPWERVAVSLAHYEASASVKRYVLCIRTLIKHFCKFIYGTLKKSRIGGVGESLTFEWWKKQAGLIGEQPKQPMH
jgi:hypothetical protein